MQICNRSAFLPSFLETHSFEYLHDSRCVLSHPHYVLWMKK
jgi:hypothetical protein